MIVNDIPSGFFHSSKGLRQEDPLSPYLFFIVMEANSYLLKRAKEGCYLMGVKMRDEGGVGEEVSHLLFAYDTLVLYEASQDQTVHLSWLLMLFEALLGLKINLNKNELIFIGRVDHLEELMEELGCKEGKRPAIYLGLPLGAPLRSVAT